MSELLSWILVLFLLIVIAWMAKDRKDMREEIRRLWEAEDIRRGIRPEPGICEECGVDVDDYRELCPACQRSILQSGDH